MNTIGSFVSVFQDILISCTDLRKDNPAKFAGAPVSLQLVGRRYEDERILGIWTHIEEEIGVPFASYT